MFCACDDVTGEIWCKCVCNTTSVKEVEMGGNDSVIAYNLDLLTKNEEKRNLNK